MRFYNSLRSSRPTTLPTHARLGISKMRKRTLQLPQATFLVRAPIPPLSVSENLRTIEVEVRCGPVTPMTRQFLTYYTPGHPVPHCRLSTHMPADGVGRPTSHEKPRPLWPQKSRKAQNRQPNPRQVCRSLCCTFHTASPL